MKLEDSIKQALDTKRINRGAEAMRKAQKVTTEQDRQKGETDYAYVDSYLDDIVDGDWRDGSLFNYFHRVIKGYDSLKNYIEDTLQEKQGEAIGIEFGGMGINLFKDFSSEFFKKSIGVSLSDYRNIDGKLYGSKIRTYSDGRQHNIIIGNLFTPAVYKEVDEILKGEKVDLVIERMAAGLDNVPDNFMVVMSVLQRWYAILNEGGLMLVEVPVFTIEVVKEWAELIKKEFANTIDIEFDEFRGALRIRKLSGAPKKLPILKLEEVNEILNKNEAQDSPINNL